LPTEQNDGIESLIYLTKNTLIVPKNSIKY